SAVDSQRGPSRRPRHPGAATGPRVLRGPPAAHGLGRGETAAYGMTDRSSRGSVCTTSQRVRIAHETTHTVKTAASSNDGPLHTGMRPDRLRPISESRN